MKCSYQMHLVDFVENFIVQSRTNTYQFVKYNGIIPSTLIQVFHMSFICSNPHRHIQCQIISSP